MIQLESVHVTFNPGTPLVNRALTGVTLAISPGQFVTVIGSNGAGKSTLLNVLSGDVTPDRGSVWINHQDVTGWPTPQRAKWVARVFQNPLVGSCADLTIAENLALAHRRGQPRRLAPALPKPLCQEFQARLASLGLGLEKRLNDRMGQLSGGQRQIVSLLMATLTEHEILLLDEHTAALDPKMAAVVLELTRSLVTERRLTTLMVTHSMRQALAIGDRTLMLHQGRVILDIAGEPRAGLTVADLLQQFAALQGDELADDALLLG